MVDYLGTAIPIALPFQGATGFIRPSTGENGVLRRVKIGDCLYLLVQENAYVYGLNGEGAVEVVAEHLLP
jgi:hypothetical protein